MVPGGHPVSKFRMCQYENNHLGKLHISAVTTTTTVLRPLDFVQDYLGELAPER